MKKTILVTGSAKGIGKEIILKFAKCGYNVVINYLNSKKEAIELKNTVENLYKVKALAICCDITSEEEVDNMTRVIKDEFGSIDILVNNSCYCYDDNYKDKTKETFMRVLEVNCFGTFLATKKCLMNLNVKKVINISSLDATCTYNELSMDYSASKAGVNLLTKTFALEEKDVNFVSIMLPWVNTESTREMLPSFLEEELKRTNQERLIESEEVADKIYKLSNDNIKSGSIIDYRSYGV